MDAMMASLRVDQLHGDDFHLGATLPTGGTPFASYDPSLDSTTRILRFPFWAPRLTRTAFSLRVSRAF